MGRAPIAHPPGSETRARPQRADQRPQHQARRAHGLDQIVGRFGMLDAGRLDRHPAAFDGDVARPMCVRSVFAWSRCRAPAECGRSVTGSAVSRHAASAGSAEFFAPLTAISPSSGTPP